MAFYIGEMKKVRNSFFEAYKDGDYKKAIVRRLFWGISYCRFMRKTMTATVLSMRWI